MEDCFISLGGNIGDTFSIMEQTVLTIASNKNIKNLISSRLFQTSPVSPIPQGDYLNAVCRFRTDLTPLELFTFLQSVEMSMGKANKPKFAPRVIDIDLLFYGSFSIQHEQLTIPHPAWHQRLFVMTPLADLVDDTFYYKVKDHLNAFTNPFQEKVQPIAKSLPFESYSLRSLHEKG